MCFVANSNRRAYEEHKEVLHYDTGAERVLVELEQSTRADGFIRLDEFVRRLLTLPPNSCRMAAATAAPGVIEVTDRRALRQVDNGQAPGRSNDLTTFGRELHVVDAEARELAESEG